MRGLLAYLHLTMIYSRGHCQHHAHFDSEYLEMVKDMAIMLLLLNLYIKSCIGFEWHICILHFINCS